MGKTVKEYNNNYSILFGLLCFGVVYLHSDWAGGFDIYTFGVKSSLLKKLSALLLMSIVPSFFILWGYLSCKYFYSHERPLQFLKKKIIQFYPLYFFSFTINMVTRSDYMFDLPRWKLVLALMGMYYESGLWGGGHIFLVVLAVIITISIFKLFNLRRRGIFLCGIMVLIAAKALPHESDLCYIKYFGYYAAFFLGALLKHYSAFDGPLYLKNTFERALMLAIMGVGMMTPLLNFFKIYALEIEYNPNSPEQLFFSVLLIYLLSRMLDRLPYLRDRFFLGKVIHKIGNNAYGHFILQSHIIRLIIYLNSFLLVNKFVLQLFIIIFTSSIVVYLLLPIYRSTETLVFKVLPS
ncbi:MAG: acyltransferase [Deltaproteobacteria bacterium]|nr:acyltransferase [Deltaproteobacteria bacterium]